MGVQVVSGDEFFLLIREWHRDPLWPVGFGR